MRHRKQITACPHGTRKHFGLGMCHTCYTKHYEKAHPEQTTAYRRKYQKRYYKRNTRRVRDRSLKWAFGLPSGQYDLMLSRQKGVCAICRGPETQMLHGKLKCLAVDHQHETGTVRGLLCSKCNTRLGWFEKVQDGVLEYLARWDRERKAA
jgi:hypothetical protein